VKSELRLPEAVMKLLLTYLLVLMSAILQLGELALVQAGMAGRGHVRLCLFQSILCTGVNATCCLSQLAAIDSGVRSPAPYIRGRVANAAHTNDMSIRSEKLKVTHQLVFGAAVAAVLALSGCATPDFVREQVAPVQSQVGELRTQVQAQDGSLKALDGRVKTSEERIELLQQEALARAKAASEAAAAAAAAGQSASAAAAAAPPAPTFAMSVILTDDRVRFQHGKAALSSEGAAELDQLLGRLKADNKPVFVEIQGHTDASGTDAVNLRLGQQRAEAVRLHLARAGMPVARMAAISYGETAPLADNKTSDGRRQNRRVQVVVLR
jgi:outer membrane protein OmpA-like peptidoglycan-associated protein